MHHSFQQHILTNPTDTSEIQRFNRAYPLWSSNANYSIPKPDPRPSIPHYLEFVDLGTDPRRLIRAWRVLEQTYGVPPTPSHRMRVWLADAAVEERLQIATLDQARRMRLREEWDWEHQWDKWGYYDLHFPGYSNPDDEDSLGFSKTQNAVGFWAVPLEVFGEVPEVDFDTYRWDMNKVGDLRGVKGGVELGLFEIS